MSGDAPVDPFCTQIKVQGLRLREYGVILHASDDNLMFIGRPEHGKVLTPTIQPELFRYRYFALIRLDLHYNIAYW